MTPSVIYHPNYDWLSKVIERAQTFIDRRKAEREKLLAKSKVVCFGWLPQHKDGKWVGAITGCGAVLNVADLTYLQTHWYVAPYSCSGGDYWREGEGQFCCPKCAEKNRLIYRPEVVALKQYFGQVKDVYER